MMKGTTMSETQPARRPKSRGAVSKVPSPQREVCPKCGSPNARIIGRSESFPILYFRCEDCRRTSVGPAV
jgi:transposase-like protein